MELLQLRYFFESAKNENFAKTAEKYMVPTTSVSASVKRLENELGCKLFDRTSNRIILNVKGKLLQQTLCNVFAQLDETVEELTSAEVDDREIKMLVRAMRSNITDYIIEYKEKNPHIAFKTVFDFGETEFEKYDIIIDEKTDKYPEYEKFELSSMRLRLKVARKSSLCDRKLTMKQLAGQSFVSMDEQNNMHKILTGACKRAGFTPDITVLSNDIKCYEKLIESGIGIGMGRESTSGEKTAFLDVADFDEKYQVYGYYKKQAAYGNVENFLRFLKIKARR